MQEFIKKHNTGIVVGLISTMIFIYLLQPGLEFLGTFIVNIGATLGASYVDEIFSQISHLELMGFGFFFFVIMATLTIFLMVASVVFIWTKDKVKPPADKIDKIDKIDNKVNPIKRKLPITIISIISIAFSVTVISTKAYQLSLITSFKQHLRIISPYISTQEEKFLLSEWSLIKTKNDYELVYFKLNNLAKKNNIELPDNSIYALDSL